jgi:hypothetical protein
MGFVELKMKADVPKEEQVRKVMDEDANSK